MKTITIILISLISFTAMAQQKFEGYITYGISTSGSETPGEIPKELIATYKEDQMKLEIFSTTFDFQIITNAKEEASTFIIDVKKEGLSMKLALKTNKEELKREFKMEESPRITYTNQKKRIAGYWCTKAIISTAEGDDAYAYLSDEIKASGFNWLLDHQLQGTIMELYWKNSDGSTHLYATDVTRDEVHDSTFEMPDDCFLISSDDVKSMLNDSLSF